MISIGIATWLELLVCKSWASRHPAGELYNFDLVNAESSHWCVYIRQMFAFLKKPLVGFDSGDTYDCLREHFTFPRLLVAQPLLV